MEVIRGSNDFPFHFQDAQLYTRLRLPNGGPLGLTAYTGKDLLQHQAEGTQILNNPGGPVVITDDDDETITFDSGIASPG